MTAPPAPVTVVWMPFAKTALDAASAGAHAVPFVETASGETWMRKGETAFRPIMQRSVAVLPPDIAAILSAGLAGAEAAGAGAADIFLSMYEQADAPLSRANAAVSVLPEPFDQPLCAGDLLIAAAVRRGGASSGGGSTSGSTSGGSSLVFVPPNVKVWRAMFAAVNAARIQAQEQGRRVRDMLSGKVDANGHKKKRVVAVKAPSARGPRAGTKKAAKPKRRGRRKSEASEASEDEEEDEDADDAGGDDDEAEASPEDEEEEALEVLEGGELEEEDEEEEDEAEAEDEEVEPEADDESEVEAESELEEESEAESEESEAESEAAEAESEDEAPPAAATATVPLAAQLAGTKRARGTT